MSLCDKKSVGVLVVRNGRYLTFDRANEPMGAACVAGHRDKHQDPVEAESFEEVGLTVVEKKLLTSGWLSNRCRRDPAVGAIGHHWEIYAAVTTGGVKVDPREARNPRWLTRGELQELAEVTIARAEGRVAATDFERQPWLESPWCYWLDKLNIINLLPVDLARIVAFSGTRSAIGLPE